MEKLVGIILEKDGKYLIEERTKDNDFGAGEFWIIGGHVENETVEQAVIRETKEELGIYLDEYEFVCELPWKRDGKKYLVSYFVCRKWTGALECNEAEKLHWITKNELDKLDEEIDKEAIRRIT
jgi:8-oxo-dGTP diphosphatase